MSCLLLLLIIVEFGIVIVLSCVGSAGVKVVSCASVRCTFKYNILHQYLNLMLFVTEAKVNALIVGLVKILLVNVCERYVSCTTSDIVKVTVVLEALLAIFNHQKKLMFH